MGQHARRAHPPVDGAAQRLLCRVQSRPGCRCITTDTCVPISRLADCLLESVDEADASASPLLVGHVGDGNFHFGYLIDPNIPKNATSPKP